MLSESQHHDNVMKDPGAAIYIKDIHIMAQDLIEVKETVHAAPIEIRIVQSEYILQNINHLSDGGQSQVMKTNILDAIAA